MSRHIKRTGQSSNRLTYDKVYELDDRGSIIDDNGNSMKPCHSNPEYWIPVAQESKTEVVKMLKIRSTVMLSLNGDNERDQKNYSVEELIALIKQEEEKIEYLKSVKVDSPAIARLTNVHKENIANLSKILEDRE